MAFMEASVADVAAYVRQLHLDGFTFTDYADILESERINGKVFLALTLDGFNSIGIIDYPRRKLFHQHLELLRSQQNSEDSVYPTTMPHVHQDTEDRKLPLHTIQLKLEPVRSQPTADLPQIHSLPNVPVMPSPENVQHQAFHEAIRNLLSSNKHHLNLPPFPSLPSMPSVSTVAMSDSNPFSSVNALKRPFCAMNDDRIRRDNLKPLPLPPGLQPMTVQSAKRRKLNESADSFSSTQPNMATASGKSTSVDSMDTMLAPKRKGTNRRTYRRWTEQEDHWMRMVCADKAPSKIDWKWLHSEKMPYRTLCGIRQHWENLKRHDKVKAERELKKTRFIVSRKSLYESDDSSEENEDEDSQYRYSGGDSQSGDGPEKEGEGNTNGMPALTE